MIWKHIARALPGGESLTDIDGLLEKNGHFLFIECKAPGAEVPMGQRTMLEKANRLLQVTVFIVTGFTEEETGALEVWAPGGGLRKTYQPIDGRGVAQRVANWHGWVMGREPYRVPKWPQEQTTEGWLDEYCD